jgi:hypothetical protein
MWLNRDDFPWLGQLRSGMFPDCEKHVLDPDAMPESIISRWPDDALSTLRAEAARALGILEDLDDEEGVRWLSLQVALPVGNSAHEWIRYLTEHLEEFYPRRTPSTTGGDGILLPRVTDFADKAAANVAATEVNRANAATLRAWAADPQSPWRLHLYADLGTEVGHMVRRTEVEAHRSDPKTAPPPVKHPVSGCVVLFRKHPETREPFIAVTYPETSLPTDTRDRYPDLPLLFGGYFGQDYTELDHDRWAAERNFNFSTPPVVKDRIANQLADLLTQDDDTLRRDVEALGSYVLPNALRRWVTGLHRRMTRIDWSRR